MPKYKRLCLEFFFTLSKSEDSLLSSFAFFKTMEIESETIKKINCIQGKGLKVSYCGGQQEEEKLSVTNNESYFLGVLTSTE